MADGGVVDPNAPPPDTGPGAGRAYPSNWNVNDSPQFSGNNALIARAPAPLPPGFNVGEASTDRALNQKVYGTNYLPGNLPGFTNVKTMEDFKKLSPQQQGAYRSALYQQHSTQPGAGGASYEASPLYQWQLAQGERGINRALAARGRYDSSFGLNTLANFYRQSAAEEADKQYNRQWQRTLLGANMAGQQSSQLAQFTQAIAAGSFKGAEQLTDAFTNFARMQGINIDNAAVQKAKNEWLRTAGIVDANNMSAGAQSAMFQYLGQLFMNAPGAYSALKGGTPSGIPTAQPIGSDFGVTGFNQPAALPAYNALGS